MRRNQVSGLRIQGWARKEADGISARSVLEPGSSSLIASPDLNPDTRFLIPSALG
jgi:hypothetical protein